jgi:hypothetical protein
MHAKHTNKKQSFSLHASESSAINSISKCFIVQGLTFEVGGAVDAGVVVGTTCDHFSVTSSDCQ